MVPCTDADALFNAFTEIFNPAQNVQESVYMLALDIKLNIVGAFELARGSMDCCPVDLKTIFQRLALTPAASFAICHNHPSGVPAPSLEDIDLTKRIKAAADIMGYSFIDHIIIGSTSETTDYNSIRSTAPHAFTA